MGQGFKRRDLGDSGQEALSGHSGREYPWSTPLDATRSLGSSTPATTTAGVDYTSERRLSAMFLVVPAVLMLLVSVGPLLYSLGLSFFRWRMDLPLNRPVFVGIANYLDLLRDPVLHKSLLITLIYVVTSVAIQLALGMLGAHLITSKVRGVGVIRTALLVPFMMTPVVVGVLWRTLFHSTYGLINAGLSLLSVPPQPWLGDSQQALAAVIAIEIWMHTPVAVFILAAGLQALPVDLNKAAQVDGASASQTFRYITLPLLKPVILVVLLIRTIEAIKQIDLIYTLTYGGPGRSTEFVALLIYKHGLQRFDVGYASAMSWVLLLVVLAMGMFFLRSILRRDKR